MRTVTAYKEVFNTDHGKRVLNDLRDSFDNDNIFVKGDSHETAYRLGRRDVVKRIQSLSQMEFEPSREEVENG